MKKIFLHVLLLTIFLITFEGCNSTKQIHNGPDEYIVEDNSITHANSENIEFENKKNPDKKKENLLKNTFSFGNSDGYIRYDFTTVFTKELNGLQERNATVVLRTDNLMAGFGSYNMAAYYYIQLDKENRTKLANAAEAYFSDFENKKLQRNGKNTYRAYGKIQYMLNWGVVSSSTPNNGIGDGFCGYQFIKGSPYFIISNFPIRNDYYEKAGDVVVRESPSIKYYFTRSQIRQLIKALSENTIDEKISEYNMNYIITPTIKDEYEF